MKKYRRKLWQFLQSLNLRVIFSISSYSLIYLSDYNFLGGDIVFINFCHSAKKKEIDTLIYFLLLVNYRHYTVTICQASFTGKFHLIYCYLDTNLNCKKTNEKKTN